MKYLLLYVICLKATFVPESSQKTSNLDTKRNLSLTRRILRGSEVGDTRPYMVYLRPASTESNIDANWLCGGVIVDAQHILTSAACIEDIRHFYVVSGTHRWVPKDVNDECVRNGAKKAVWKCVPLSYVFDGNDFDNIRWMINDIAVVRVEDDFNFERRIRGCDFVPKVIAYNNKNEELENSGTVASIAGWGSVDYFGDVYGRTSHNSPNLLETDVVLISKKSCKSRWPERYHHIIDGNMICAKDSSDDNMNDLCEEQEISCKELVYSDEGKETRRFIIEPESLRVHTARHNETRRSKVISGGFCENDHGGPLVVGYGTGAVVVGVISACQTANITQKCYGPYLYTSVWKNRHLIDCAINKNTAASCKLLLRSSRTRINETVFNWSRHPDGQAKSEIFNSDASSLPQPEKPNENSQSKKHRYVKPRIHKKNI